MESSEEKEALEGDLYKTGIVFCSLWKLRYKADDETEKMEEAKGQNRFWCGFFWAKHQTPHRFSVCGCKKTERNLPS